MKKRVVITGMGAITPLGHTVAELYRCQVEGKSGVGPISLFNAQRFPTKIAAQVKNFNLADHIQDGETWKDSGANSCFAAAAARHALENAGLLDNDKIDRDRFGVYLGSGEGIQDFHNLVSLIGHNYNDKERAVDSASFDARRSHDSTRAANPNRSFTPRRLAS